MNQPFSSSKPLLDSPGGRPFRAHSTWNNASAVWIVAPGLLLTTVLSILLVYSASRHKTFSGQFLQIIDNHRATTQILVQIISHMLGLIHIFALTKLFNAFTTKYFQQRAVTLDCLKWWNSICHLQFDHSLPWRFLLPLTVLIGKLTFKPKVHPLRSTC